MSLEQPKTYSQPEVELLNLSSPMNFWPSRIALYGLLVEVLRVLFASLSQGLAPFFFSLAGPETNPHSVCHHSVCHCHMFIDYNIL